VLTELLRHVASNLHQVAGGVTAIEGHLTILGAVPVVNDNLDAIAGALPVVALTANAKAKRRWGGGVMALWWLGNLILAAAIIPVVVMLLNNLLKPVAKTGAEADAILAGGVTVASQLDQLEHVVHTRDSIQQP
jgi:hypothetical protein